MNPRGLTTQYVKFVTVERPGALIVFAILMEGQGEHAIALSDPRIVKIIPRKAAIALAAGKTTSRNFLFGNISLQSIKTPAPIISPYVTLFGYRNSDILSHLGARPPTVA